jgi:hypothetical protein
VVEELDHPLDHVAAAPAGGGDAATPTTAKATASEATWAARRPAAHHRLAWRLDALDRRYLGPAGPFRDIAHQGGPFGQVIVAGLRDQRCMQESVGRAVFGLDEAKTLD